MSAHILGSVDAIYDRAALVALPSELRQKYASHLLDISQRAPQLLISFDYEQKAMSGPPFSVDDNQVHGYYQEQYNLNLVANDKVVEPVKGNSDILEKVWILN